MEIATNLTGAPFSSPASNMTILKRFQALSDAATLQTIIEYDTVSIPAIDFFATVTTKARQLRESFFQLTGRNMTPGEAIGVDCYRSEDTLSDVLAILFAGGAFVPLNLKDPIDRIQYAINDSHMPLYLTNGTLVNTNTNQRTTLNTYQPRLQETLPNVASDQLAYIMYTSGSTGRPKGVRVLHSSLWAYLSWFETLNIQNDVTKVDFSSNLTFDGTITTSLIALATNKIVSVCPEDIKISPRAFIEYLGQKKIDLCKCTPSYFKLLVNKITQNGSSLSRPMTWLLTGEEMNVKDTANWLNRHADHVFYNSYGPTECTVTCSKFKIDKSNIARYQKSFPIAGRQRNARFHILDQHMTPVRQGQHGELYLESDAVADGYQNDAEKTQQSFIRTSKGQLLYKTGDQVSETADGLVFYHGRTDNQVKLRGVRVDLDELRHILCERLDIQDAKVIVHTKDEISTLVAFVVPNRLTIDKEALVDQLQRYLMDRLPAAMTPQNIIVIPKMPINTSGKIDCSALEHALTEIEIQPVKMIAVNPLELAILDIWRQSLPNRKIGMDSNFSRLEEIRC